MRTALSSTLMLLMALCMPLWMHAANAQTVSGNTEDSDNLPACLSSPSDCDGEEWLHERETLTGGWRGVRPSLEERGITFEGHVTQFSQGVASGGLNQRLRYGGHGDYDLTFDFGKMNKRLLLWESVVHA